MTKIIEKETILELAEGKCIRVETKISEDGKKVVITTFAEVTIEDEVKVETEEKEIESTNKKIERHKEIEENEEVVEEDVAEEKEYTLDDYMDALKKEGEALEALKEKERKFEENMHRKAIPSQDFPDCWEKFDKARSEVYKLSEKVVYCGKKAIHWSQLGFRNIRKTWKLEEYWYQDITLKDLLKRTITWQGTLEEYCQNYNLYINSSMYTCKLKRFYGTAMQNTPDGVSMWDKVEVNILE